MRDFDKDVKRQLQRLLYDAEDGEVRGPSGKDGPIAVLADDGEVGVSQEVFDLAKAEGLIYFVPGSNRWMPSDAGTRLLMELDAKYPKSPEG